MKTVIVDIDGTVADCRHRLHHVLPGGKRDWKSFFAEIPHDPPIQPVVDLVQSLAQSFRIVMASGRSEDERDVTVAQLDAFGVPYDRMYMRASGDTRPDDVVKRQILAGIREDGYEPFIVIDDRQSVVDMWRDEGLVCLQAAPPQANMPSHARLVLMVGPSGAGKSTWLKGSLFEPHHVISSDELRHDICGNFKDQSRNAEVFDAMHKLATARLRLALPTVIDATNIRRKDRVTLAKLVPDTCEVEYIVINRPMVDKRLMGGWRNEVYKNGEWFDLIAAHENTFQNNLKDILRGDDMRNVTVTDYRIFEGGSGLKVAV